MNGNLTVIESNTDLVAIGKGNGVPHKGKRSRRILKSTVDHLWKRSRLFCNGAEGTDETASEIIQLKRVRGDVDGNTTVVERWRQDIERRKSRV